MLTQVAPTAFLGHSALSAQNHTVHLTLFNIILHYLTLFNIIHSRMLQRKTSQTHLLSWNPTGKLFTLKQQDTEQCRLPVSEIRAKATLALKIQWV